MMMFTQSGQRSNMKLVLSFQTSHNFTELLGQFYHFSVRFLDWKIALTTEGITLKVWQWWVCVCLCITLILLLEGSQLLLKPGALCPGATKSAGRVTSRCKWERALGEALTVESKPYKGWGLAGLPAAIWTCGFGGRGLAEWCKPEKETQKVQIVFKCCFK